MKKLVVALVLAVVGNQSLAMSLSQAEKYLQVVEPALECGYLYTIAKQPQNAQRMHTLAYERIRLIVPTFLSEMKKEIKKENITVPEHPAFNLDNIDYWTGKLLGSAESETKDRIGDIIFKASDYKLMAEIEIRNRNCDFIR